MRATLRHHGGTCMAPTLALKTEMHLRAAAQERSLESAQTREEFPAQGSAEWEKRLRSLGQNFRGVPLSTDATSREVIYEDAAL